MAAVCGYYAVQGYGTQEYSMTADEFSQTLQGCYGS